MIRNIVSKRVGLFAFPAVFTLIAYEDCGLEEGKTKERRCGLIEGVSLNGNLLITVDAVVFVALAFFTFLLRRKDETKPSHKSHFSLFTFDA
jgi:hypothetical protein